MDLNNIPNEKVGTLIDNMTEYFSTIPTYEGLDNKLKFLNEKLDEMKTVINDLNQNIKEANESSDKLTTALNKITQNGVFVGILALIVAAGNLSFEIYKYFNI